ncbi:MAG TPA: hypothetical protein VKA38_10325 [Draconibacterium sp.]|nr:hypothetical protein [Draconibacterium sp.]
MGIERDYLMRQLMMLFEVIQKILRYRQKGEKKPALDQIKYFYECLKVDESVHKKGIKELMDYLVLERKLTNEYLEMIAFVLKEQGELEADADQKLDFFRKAYFLLDKVDRESTTFSMDRQMKLAELRTCLN